MAKLMNKQKVVNALKLITDEILNEDDLSQDMVVYQIYCAMNDYIAKWVKNRLAENPEIGIPADDPQRIVIYEMSSKLTEVMCKYSSIVKEQEDKYAKKFN